MISYYISGYEYDQKRTQDPTFQDNLIVRQRKINQDTGQYETTQGQAFTVKRLMPVPYNLRLNVDVWTSNYKQKLELFEQLSILFNPSLELQSNPNLIDWTSLSVVYQDGITWTSRTIPQGTGNPIDVMTWKFYTPIWLSAPIKVEKLGVIQKIITSIFSGNELKDTQNDDLLLGTRQKIAPYGYKVLLVGGDLQLIPNNQPELPPLDEIESIASVLVALADPNSNFTFYTKDPCLNVEVGQWIRFEGVQNYPVITDVFATFVSIAMLPTSSSDTIVTISNAVNAVVTTSDSHGLITGDVVQITGAAGSDDWIELNSNNYAVTVLSETTFSILVDTTSFGQYSSTVGKLMTNLTGITVDIQQDFVVGQQVDFVPKVNPATDLYWHAYLNVLGTIRPGASLIALQNPDLPTEIVGTIEYHETDDRLLKFTIDPDTLPTDTLDPVNSVIDPLEKYPNTLMNMNGALPVAALGQRYLIVNDIGTTNTARLVIKSRNDYPAGVTMIEVQRAFDAEPMDYVDAVVSAVTSTGQQIFAPNTKIMNVTALASNVWAVTVDRGTIAVIPKTYDAATRTIIRNIAISTSLQIAPSSSSWGDLVANANDIIEYGTNTITTTTTENGMMGQEVIYVADATGIRVGYGVSGSNIMTGTLVSRVDGNIITIDTPLGGSFGVGAEITFTSVGNVWYVSFDSTGGTGTPGSQIQFVTNLTTDIQYRWGEGQWTKSYEGYYESGDWFVII